MAAYRVQGPLQDAFPSVTLLVPVPPSRGEGVRMGLEFVKLQEKTFRTTLS